jgi:hypothetical protein
MGSHRTNSIADFINLPKCVHATRIGYDPESEYDLLGLIAPVTWICNCKKRLKLELWDSDADQYYPISKEERDQFLSEHVSCTAKCYKCDTTPVDSYGMWCDPCEEKEDYFYP